MTKEEAAEKYADDSWDYDANHTKLQKAFLAGVEWVEQKKKDSIKAGDWELDR
jgi:hypothetical protein